VLGETRLGLGRSEARARIGAERRDDAVDGLPVRRLVECTAD
jgi:hypothetical protein